jgi:hypothetical protein
LPESKGRLLNSFRLTLLPAFLNTDLPAPTTSGLTIIPQFVDKAHLEEVHRQIGAGEDRYVLAGLLLECPQPLDVADEPRIGPGGLVERHLERRAGGRPRSTRWSQGRPGTGRWLERRGASPDPEAAPRHQLPAGLRAEECARSRLRWLPSRRRAGDEKTASRARRRSSGSRKAARWRTPHRM